MEGVTNIWQSSLVQCLDIKLMLLYYEYLVLFSVQR
jgi:hypothetical protein